MGDSELVFTSNIVHNNVYLKEYKNEGESAKKIGFKVAFYFFIGSSFLCSSNQMHSTELSNMTKASCIKNINLESLSGSNIFSMGNSIDLLKMENINKIDKMQKFEVNWNGNGAPGFKATSINLFREVICNVRKQPQIAPTGKASLLLQYEKSDKSILVFDVSDEKTEMVFVPQGDYSKAEVKIFTDEFNKSINSNVEKFYELG